MNAGEINAKEQPSSHSPEKDKVVAIIKNAYLKGRRLKTLILHEDDTLLSKLGLDSLEIMQIIVQIETQFNLVIDDQELRIENFETVGSLCQWVENLVRKEKTI